MLSRLRLAHRLRPTSVTPYSARFASQSANETAGSSEWRTGTRLSAFIALNPALSAAIGALSATAFYAVMCYGPADRTAFHTEKVGDTDVVSGGNFSEPGAKQHTSSAKRSSPSKMEIDDRAYQMAGTQYGSYDGVRDEGRGNGGSNTAASQSRSTSRPAGELLSDRYESTGRVADRQVRPYGQSIPECLEGREPLDKVDELRSQNGDGINYENQRHTVKDIIRGDWKESKNMTVHDLKFDRRLDDGPNVADQGLLRKAKKDEERAIRKSSGMQDGKLTWDAQGLRKKDGDDE
jgi:hypothetical protein